MWITVFLAIIVSMNYIHHGLPSQVEYYVSFVKLVVMFALMVLSLVIALGGGPDGDLKGFRYWKHPGAFGARPNTSLMEKLFRTCGTMSSATFAYVGSERSGIMAQSPNVRKAISRAIKNTYYRILVFHLIGVTLLGMIVPYNSAALVFSSPASKEKAASPFVAALYCAGMAVLPDLLNGFILLFVLSIANYDLYLATKAMCDLSLKNRAPAFLSRSNRRGVPIYALGVCSLLASLSYISLASNAIQVFGYFVDTVTMLGLLTWISTLITHVSFVRARKAQGIPNTALIFRARFGLTGTWFALCLCVFIAATIVFKAFSFKPENPKFDYRTVVASYFGVPLFIGLFVGHRLVAKSKFVTPQEVDMWTDKQNLRQREMENTRG